MSPELSPTELWKLWSLVATGSQVSRALFRQRLLKGWDAGRAASTPARRLTKRARKHYGNKPAPPVPDPEVRRINRLIYSMGGRAHVVGFATHQTNQEPTP